MIKELSRLLDGNYFFLMDDSTSFYGSRVDVLEYLHDCGFSDAEVGVIMTVLDSLPAVNMPATRQGYC